MHAPWQPFDISSEQQLLGAVLINNEAVAHCCGTCRFGSDPKTSVLDPHNRAHDVENLYVADGSFFPSSAGLNPSLTIAANALGPHASTPVRMMVIAVGVAVAVR